MRIKILEFNQCRKFDKAPFVIYADFESFIKMIECRNNLGKKIGKHIPTNFSIDI